MSDLTLTQWFWIGVVVYLGYCIRQKVKQAAESQTAKTVARVGVRYLLGRWFK